MGKRTSYNRRNKRKDKKKSFLKTKIVLGLFIVAGIGFFMVKANEPKMEAQINQADPIVNEVVAAVSDKIKVDDDNDLVISPVDEEPQKGLILYPETDVAADAYIPMATRLAEKGYLVVIPKFLFNNPTLDTNKVNSIINAYPIVNHWAVGGHGEGGILASKALTGNPKIRGAFFLASYPDETVDLSAVPINVVSVYGDKDGVLDVNEFKAKQSKLPKDTVYTVIENGNHSYFGNYEKEETGITSEEQQVQTLVQLINLMDELREST